MCEHPKDLERILLSVPAFAELTNYLPSGEGAPEIRAADLAVRRLQMSMNMPLPALDLDGYQGGNEHTNSNQNQKQSSLLQTAWHSVKDPWKKRKGATLRQQQQQHAGGGGGKEEYFVDAARCRLSASR